MNSTTPLRSTLRSELQSALRSALRSTLPSALPPSLRPALLSAFFPALLLQPLPADAQQGRADVGRTKAHQCAVCHGPLGQASAPDAPHLSGQNAAYTEAALKAYRSGARRHEVMAVMARPLSDQDIADLAAWYASIKVEVSPP